MEVEVETEVEEERAKDKEEKEDRVRLMKKEEGRGKREGHERRGFSMKRAWEGEGNRPATRTYEREE